MNAKQASKRTMRRPTRQPFRGRLTRLGYLAKFEDRGGTVEADLGPVKYLATLLGATDEAILRYFTLIFSLLLDPAAVLLLLAATRTECS